MRDSGKVPIYSHRGKRSDWYVGQPKKIGAEASVMTNRGPGRLGVARFVPWPRVGCLSSAEMSSIAFVENP